MIKRITGLICLLLLVGQFYGQTSVTTTTMIGPFAAYRGQQPNWKWPLVVSLPQEALDYRAGLTKVKPKCACSLDGHGIGERSTSYPSMSTYGSGDAYYVFRYGQPIYWQYNTSAYWGVHYSSPGKSENKCWIYAAFQVWQGDAYIWPTYYRNSLKYLIQTYGDVMDLDYVYITGLSFGAGGGAGVALQDPEVLDMIAGVHLLMVGYDNTPGFTPSYNWKILKDKDWKGLIVLEHSIDDDITTKSPVTGSGAYWAERVADSLLKYKGSYRVVFRRRTTGKHTVPVIDAWNPARANVVIPMANGNTYTHAIPWQSFLLTASRSGWKKD